MIQELSLQSFFHAFALLCVAHHTPKTEIECQCFGHMWSIRYRSTMRHKLANRMAQQARILSITNIKYRWKPPAASLDIENENIQLRHENSTATSRNNFLASTVLNDCAHFLHHSKFDTTEISTLILFSFECFLVILLSIPYFIRLIDKCILQIVGFSYWLTAPSYAFSRSLRLAQKVFTILPVNIVRANMIHSAIELVHLHTNSLLFTIMQKLIRSTIELVHNLQHMKMKRSDGEKQSRTWTEVQFHLRR